MELYHINQQHKLLLAEIEQNDGELTPELEAKLKALDLSLNESFASLAYSTKQLDDQSLLIGNEIKRLQALKASVDNSSSYIKEYLKTVLIEKGIEKVKENNISISFRKSTAVEVYDLEMLPTEYQSVTVTANKTAISKALKEGEEVKGATLVERQNLQIK